MHLPSEIYNLVSSDRFPSYGISTLTLNIGLQILEFLDTSSWYDSDPYSPRIERGLFPDDRQSFQNFRLASKALCKAASPFLFCAVNAGSIYEMWKVHAISESIYGPCVQRLTISPAEDLEQADSPESYLSQMCMTLPICVRNLPRLRILSIDNPRWDKVGSSKISSDILFRAAQIISRFGRFPELEELNLSLNVAYGFAIQALSGPPMKPTKHRRPLEECLSQLRSLHVDIRDYTYGEHDGSLETPMSEAQILFPNLNHGRKMIFGFIEVATRLESLSLGCDQLLDVDGLNIAAFKRLKTLTLSRVQISVEHLQTLITQNKATIRTLALKEIELKTGMWESILLDLCSFPHLEEICIGACGYVPCSNFALSLLPPNVEDMSVTEYLESCEWDDYDALEELQNHMMRVQDAAGLSAYGISHL